MEYREENLREISFPLGGIGTGSIGISGNGSLIDWEIFNKPSKGSLLGYSHFAIRAVNGDEITARVLNGDICKDYMGQYKMSRVHTGYGYGPEEMKMCGFPHFKNVLFEGEFPVANLKFSDEQFPAEVTMTAFNPFIPADSFNSSIPAAFFEIEVSNTTADDMRYDIAFSVASPYTESVNKSQKENGIYFITMKNQGADKDSPKYGDLTVATDCEETFSQTCWYRGAWKDKIVSFWNEFSADKEMKDRTYDTPGEDTCTLGAKVFVRSGEKRKVRFVLTWNSPNNYNYWSKEEEKTRTVWKNYYATVFENSYHSASYCVENWDSLYERTMNFKNALHSSTLPKEVIDAATSNLAVLKSPTVLRLEDGSFYGWEGVTQLAGSCEGTCQHVWNYAYALCFLFPELERSIRKLEFKHCTDENGKMSFRLMLPIGKEMDSFRACVDGQMGAVIKCYREWKISGNNEWLKSNWDNIKKVLEYAWSDKNEDAWDLDKDGVMEGRQHHTLNMELFGPSSWLEGMYLAALKAGSEMAAFLGDDEKAEEYRALYEKGRKWTEDNLFNGRYFIQKIDVRDKSVTDRFNASENYWNNETGQIKYQIADGSSIDQLLAQWHANILGLGDIFDKKQINSALTEMMKNNFKPNMRYVVNPWRIFSVNDEAGSVICDYPKGVEKPKIPVPYCEETMTGFEYSFGGLLCSEGKIEDGLRVIKAVRDRFDGKKRNPWNEFECGSNYARSMASYALIPILCGFEFDMPRNHIGFSPYTTDDFKCFWSLESAWGNVEICKNKMKINVIEGEIQLKSVGIKCLSDCKKIEIDGQPVEFEKNNETVFFEKITVKESVEISV